SLALGGDEGQGRGQLAQFWRELGSVDRLDGNTQRLLAGAPAAPLTGGAVGQGAERTLVPPGQFARHIHEQAPQVRVRIVNDEETLNSRHGGKILRRMARLKAASLINTIELARDEVGESRLNE